MDVSIRRATADDYDPLCDLFDEVDALHRANLPDLFQKPDGPVWEKDYLIELATDDNVGFFIAESDGKLVGFITAAIRDAPAMPIFVPRRYAIIDNMGVDSGHRNRGIGRMLINTTHEWARDKGATSIELNVYEFNKQAIAFYESLGYRLLSHKMSRALKA